VRRLTRLAPFWRFQLAGWFAFTVAMILSRVGVYPLGLMVLWKAGLALLGLLITVGLRVLFRGIASRGLELWKVVLACVAISYLAAIPWTAAYNVYHVVVEAEYFARPPRWGIPGSLLSGTVYHAFALLAWSLLYFGVKYHDALQRERERSLRAEALAQQARLHALRYQLQPHFLFNTLNAISTLVVDGRQREASAMIARLSEFLRLTLDGSDTQEVPLAEEMEYVRRYLEIEQIRFGDRLAVRMDLRPDTLSIHVPAMVLQPIIENAIRHGVASRRDGGALHILSRIDAGALRIEVSNDGSGLSHVGLATPGIGITNTRQRLSQLYGGAAHLHVEATDDQRVQVTLTIPIGAAAGRRTA
jgi:two-component sensor histidine kinase